MTGSFQIGAGQVEAGGAVSVMAALATWLPYRRPAPGRPRLVAFPYAGGGAAAVHQWLSPLGDIAELCAVQLPGREGRREETPWRDMAHAVPALARALAPVMEGTPVVFFGHSMGALLAYEVARRFQETGVTLPRHLVLSGMAPPHVPHRVPPLHQMDREEAIRTLAAMGGTPRIILEEPDLMDMMLPVIQADIALVRSRPRDGGPPIARPILCLGGRDDPLAPPEDVSQWRRYGSSGVTERLFDGGHFFLTDAAGPVHAAIRSVLARPASRQTEAEAR